MWSVDLIDFFLAFGEEAGEEALQDHGVGDVGHLFFLGGLVEGWG